MLNTSEATVDPNGEEVDLLAYGEDEEELLVGSDAERGPEAAKAPPAAMLDDDDDMNGNTEPKGNRE